METAHDACFRSERQLLPLAQRRPRSSLCCRGAPTCYRARRHARGRAANGQRYDRSDRRQFRLWIRATKLTPKPVDDPEPGRHRIECGQGRCAVYPTTARRSTTHAGLDRLRRRRAHPPDWDDGRHCHGRLYFTVKNDATDACSASGLVAFYNEPGTIPTRLTTPDSTPIYPVEIDLPALAIDSTPPALSPESSVADGSLARAAARPSR